MIVVQGEFKKNGRNRGPVWLWFFCGLATYMVMEEQYGMKHGRKSYVAIASRKKVGNVTCVSSARSICVKVVK